MSDIKIGVMLAGEFFERPDLVEELGFDSIWSGEHVAAPRPTSDGIAVQSFYAGRTSRISIGSSILLLPLRPPVAMAKSITTLDRISKGRYICGIGVGGEYPEEFEAVGVSVRERGARTDEAIEILRKLWQGPENERIAHEGRFWKFNVMHTPKPVQPGGPPIWVSGRSEAAIARTARVGNGYLPYLFTLERYRKSVAKVREACEQIGRDPSELTMSCLIHVSIDTNADRALTTIRDSLSKRYGPNLRELAEHLSVWGTPEGCAERISAFAEAGCQHLVLNVTVPDGSNQEEAIREIAEILPVLRPSTAAAKA